MTIWARPPPQTRRRYIFSFIIIISSTSIVSHEQQMQNWRANKWCVHIYEDFYVLINVYFKRLNTALNMTNGVLLLYFTIHTPWDTRKGTHAVRHTDKWLVLINFFQLVANFFHFLDTVTQMANIWFKAIDHKVLVYWERSRECRHCQYQYQRKD